MLRLLLTSLLSISLMGCVAEVGSERWCKQLEKKPKGDWSMNEAKDFAKHCLLK
jgi:pantoate kinase